MSSAGISTGMVAKSPAPVLPPPSRLEDHRLRIGGAVGRPAIYDLSDLTGWPQVSVVRDHMCMDGSVVPMQRWRGVPLRTLLARAMPFERAARVTLAANDFSIALSLDAARGAIIALSLNDQPLSRARGGPFRLLVRGGGGDTSIKWLAHIEVTTKRCSGVVPSPVLERSENCSFTTTHATASSQSGAMSGQTRSPAYRSRPMTRAMMATTGARTPRPIGRVTLASGLEYRSS